MSRDKQADKYKGIRLICETAKSKGETLRITPDFVLELMDEAAAEKERGDKLQSDYDLIETNFNRLKDDRDFWEKARTKHKERADKAEAREQKLREAIQTAIEMKELNPELMETDPKGLYDAAMWFLSGIINSLYPKEGETK